MNILILLSCSLVFLILGMFIFLKSLKDYKKANFLILIALSSMWIVIGIYQNMLPNYSKYLGSWTMPTIFAVFYFVQALIRIPFAIISRNLRSRTFILRNVMLLFMVLAIPAIVINASWTIWIFAISTGIIASTYGIQNQYHAENYNLIKVFTTVGIVYAVPFVGEVVGKILYTIGGIEEISIRWMWFIAVLVSFPTFLFFLFWKENRSSIRLDDRIPSYLEYKFRKKESFILYSNIFLISFTFYLANNSGLFSFYGIETDEHWYLTIPLGFISIITGLIFSVYLLKRIGVVWSRNIGYFLLALGTLINLIFLATGNHSDFSFLVGYCISTIGYSILFTTHFGVAVHADVKNRELISAIFLSINSFAIGLAQFVSRAIFLNFIDIEQVAVIFYSLAFVGNILAIAFALIFNHQVHYIFANPITYEFK